MRRLSQPAIHPLRTRLNFRQNRKCPPKNKSTATIESVALRAGLSEDLPPEGFSFLYFFVDYVSLSWYRIPVRLRTRSGDPDVMSGLKRESRANRERTRRCHGMRNRPDATLRIEYPEGKGSGVRSSQSQKTCLNRKEPPVFDGQDGGGLIRFPSFPFERRGFFLTKRNQIT